MRQRYKDFGAVSCPRNVSREWLRQPAITRERVEEKPSAGDNDKSGKERKNGELYSSPSIMACRDHANTDFLGRSCLFFPRPQPPPSDGVPSRGHSQLSFPRSLTPRSRPRYHAKILSRETNATIRSRFRFALHDNIGHNKDGTKIDDA